MFVITNRIKTKKGFASRMAPAFTADKQIGEFEGFIKTEVLVCTSNEEFDEMDVNMYWKSLENFNVWRESDAFKNAHKQSPNDATKESPLLGSQIVMSELASSTENY